MNSGVRMQCIIEKALSWEKILFFSEIVFNYHIKNLYEPCILYLTTI